MELKDRVAVVTGGGRGIGEALCRRFAQEGAAVVVADLDEAAAKQVAETIGGLPVRTDVARPEEVQKLVEQTLGRYGRVDLFCSNAGIETGGDVDAPDEDWERIWRVNVMGHVYAARAVLPHMVARGEGYLLQTASAAGLLTQIASAPYSVTKHAAVALAEWIAIRYGKAGIRVSCLCPQGVRTSMLLDAPDEGIRNYLLPEALDPAEVAEAVVRGLAEERFLILPHPEVATFFRHKATDYDRWLRGMQRLNQQLYGLDGEADTAPHQS